MDVRFDYRKTFLSQTIVICALAAQVCRGLAAQLPEVYEQVPPYNFR